VDPEESCTKSKVCALLPEMNVKNKRMYTGTDFLKIKGVMVVGSEEQME